MQTPSKDAGILEGITRNAILELAKELGYPVQEVTLTRHDLFCRRRVLSDRQRRGSYPSCYYRWTIDRIGKRRTRHSKADGGIQKARAQVGRTCRVTTFASTCDQDVLTREAA